MEIILSTVADLADYNVGPGVVGHSAYVAATDSWYEAMLEGRGLDKWRLSKVGGVSVLGGALAAYQRVFAFDDADIVVEDTTVSIDFGSALPAGAVVVAVIADTTDAFTDGGAGTFAADVGVSGGDADLYTPTELNIDAEALQTQTPFIPASGVQLAVTLTGSVDLDTLTGGAMDLTVIYAVPVVTAITAP